jgi:hypothetical protein
MAFSWFLLRQRHASIHMHAECRARSFPRETQFTSRSARRGIEGAIQDVRPDRRSPRNVLEVAHQLAFSPLSAKSTEVNFIIETQNAAHATEVVTALRAAGSRSASWKAPAPAGSNGRILSPELAP